MRVVLGDESYWVCHTCRQYKDLGYSGYRFMFNQRWQFPDVQELMAEHQTHEARLYADPQGWVYNECVLGLQPVGPFTMGEPAEWVQGEPYTDLARDLRIGWKAGDRCPSCNEGNTVSLDGNKKWRCRRCNLSWDPKQDADMDSSNVRGDT